MTKLMVFRRQASVDTYVTLRLTRGEDVSGRIAELDDSHVCLDLGDGETITVFEDILAGWEIHGQNRVNAADEESSKHRVAAKHAGKISSDAAPHAGVAKGNTDESSKIHSELARIEASFSEAIKRARLEFPEPDFQFSEVGFPSWRVTNIRREWDRARNQYTYALKVREIGRLSSIVAQILDPLAQHYPDSHATRALLGRVLLKLNRQLEAKDHLVAAATLSDTPEHWLALAFSADTETAVECYALRRFLSLVPPHHANEAWFRYLAVATDHRDLRQLAQIILYWSEKDKADSNLNKLLSESVIYMLLSSGTRSIALEAVASLVHVAEELPQGWQDEFNRRASPSDALLAVESEFSRRSVRTSPATQPVLPKGKERVPYGRIASFGNQRFGFIDSDGGETYFFRIDDVVDEELKHVLLDGKWRMSGEVEFEILPSHGHKYNRAIKVIPLQDSKALLQKARNLLQLRQHSQAIALVRRVLNTDPTDEIARQLEAELKEDLRKQLHSHGAGLPKGQGPYAHAKRAQFIDQDLDATEKFLKLAIHKHDKEDSAIKDLASLLQQRGRAGDAIALLEKNARRFRGISPYDNMLASLYQHSDRHGDAIRILLRLSATRPPKKNTLLKQIAFSYLRLTRYDEAERALKEHLVNNPEDRVAKRWLVGLEDARSAGSDAEAEELIRDLGGLTEEGVELSSIARAAIKHCTYEGVDPARIQAGTAGPKDVARVEELARKLGIKRPRDRAAYYLSAAALLERELGDSKPERIYGNLCRYFASMADAAWIEKKPAEVVRSYYIESLALVFVDNLNEAWRSLIRYLATFSPDSLKDIEGDFPKRPHGQIIPQQEYIDFLQNTLKMINSKIETDWIEGLIDVGSQSNFARDSLGMAILTNSALHGMFDNLLGSTDHEGDGSQKKWRSICRERARAYRQLLSVCRTLTKYQATVSSMEDLDGQLRNASEEANISEIDRRRLNTLRDIVDSAQKFCVSDDFEEKERNCWLVTQNANQFRGEVLDAFTQYSHEGLLPVAEHLRSLIEEEYAQMARTSSAELSLRLLVDEYLRGQEGEIRLQIEVSNKRGCSPASSVRICLGPGDSEYFVTDHWEREAVSILRGGNSEVAQMIVQPKNAALDDRAFPIDVMAIYQNSFDEKVHTENFAWTVRLYLDDEFQHLDNPYSPFAEGGPVDDVEMFVGRDELLARLENSLLSGSGSKSIVMFGQKRAGKSSLIEHLRRRLAQREEVVPVCFSMQDIAPELSVPALFHRILYGISEALEEFRFQGKDVPEFSPLGIDTLKSDATLRFHDTMSSLIRAMAHCSSNLKFILLIDEFTDIFKEIRSDRIPRQFMKAWKAIIEKKYFSSVLIGQDIMPAFKAEFPNEFGVTEDVRVTYLDDAAAATLVEKPMGEQRFAGRAVRRLLDLTAGSPYYTMMFCARLVDYMNTTRSVILTEADIRTVEEDMLRGDRRLTKDKFDNLLCAGDGKVDSGIDPEDTYAVCSVIAQGTEKQGWCSRDLIRDFDDVALDGLLLDLETRDVVERKGTTYRLRVGLFRDWLVRQG